MIDYLKFFSFKITLFVTVVFLLLIHLLLIKWLPMPWYDETMYASIVSSVMTKGRLEAEVNTTVMEGEMHLMYGPIFFYLEFLWCKLFSFTLLYYRLFVLLAGFMSMYFTYLVASKLSPITKPLITYLFIFILFTDTFWGVSLHDGRMDTLAICFALAGFYLFLLDKNKIKYDLIIGLLFSLSLLTTPRIIVLLLAIGLYILYTIIQTKNYKQLIPFITIPIISYLLWIYLAYGSFENFYQYVFGDSIGIEQYGASFFEKFYFVPPSMKPLLIIVAITFTLACFQFSPPFKKYFPILIACFIGISFHYLFIVDWGPYAIYISPLLYFILLISFNNFKYWKIPALLLLLVNLSYWTIKITYLCKTSDARNEQTAINFIKKYIPENSKIIGDAQYYFIAKANKCSYEYLDKYGTLEKRALFHKERYKYQYIIISDQETSRCEYDFNYYKKFSKIEKIARLDYPALKLPFISGFDSKGYACTIYKRVE